MLFRSLAENAPIFPPMQKHLIMLFLIVAASTGFGCSDTKDTPRPKTEGEGGCKSEFYALADSAVVELKGSGELDVVVVTDPLCWHCRLGHKLLSEYPEKFRSLKMIFFPRKSFIGSDMAAWILEDVAGTDKLEVLVDFAYKDLKQPKNDDLPEARMVVLAQRSEERRGGKACATMGRSRWAPEH